MYKHAVPAALAVALVFVWPLLAAASLTSVEAAAAAGGPDDLPTLLLSYTGSILAGLTAVVSIASLVTAATPTPAAGTRLAKLYRLLEICALVIGKAKDTGLRSAAMLLVTTAMLSACGYLSSQAPEKSLIAACDAYAASLDALTGFRAAGRLSADQVAAVDAARPEANALCSGNLPADEASAAAMVGAITVRLAAVLRRAP
jgi:hypothetical protein